MSHTRKVALFVSVAVLALSMVVPSPTTRADALEPRPDVQPTSSEWTLVEADWCDRVCGRQCRGECLTSHIENCTCYWVCKGGDEGEQPCTGAIGVRICS